MIYALWLVRFAFALAAALALSIGAGCALTSKGEALSIRYFTPETAARPAAAPAHRTGGAALVLGSVDSGPHLRERIVYRDGAHEVGFYDDRRWTERPERYVRRELERALFDERGLTRAVSGAGPTLDVELIAFEEVKLAGTHAARVKLRYVLAADGIVLLEETRAVEQPIASAGFDGFVAATSTALETIADDVASRVAAALAAQESSER